MQLKKVKDILLGKPFKLYQVAKVWTVEVLCPLSAVYIKELQDCKGYIGMKVLDGRVKFEYLA